MLHLGMLVGGVVVHHQMQLAGRVDPGDVCKETQELLVPVSDSSHEGGAHAPPAVAYVHHSFWMAGGLRSACEVFGVEVCETAGAGRRGDAIVDHVPGHEVDHVSKARTVEGCDPQGGGQQRVRHFHYPWTFSRGLER